MGSQKQFVEAEHEREKGVIGVVFYSRELLFHPRASQARKFSRIIERTFVVRQRCTCAISSIMASCSLICANLRFKTNRVMGCYEMLDFIVSSLKKANTISASRFKVL
jgi:hypothetical protein